jgi:hypothetical protein
MKAKTVGYWLSTVAVALAVGPGGVAQALRAPQVVDGISHLGYPLHFIVLLGVWKALGAIALLVPGFALVKEWAYAGLFFDLSGAVVAIAARDELRHIALPVVLVALLVTSWVLRPESRRLAGSPLGP